jgi:hypothetical protein
MENMNHSALTHGMGVAAIATAGLIVFAILLIPLIFYILSLQKALGRCAPESRAMQPGLVWLLVIPCFGIIWHFFVVLNMAKSLGAEFQKRGIAEEPQPGQMLGLIMCGAMCGGFIPFIGPLFSLAGLVCWILYWIKIAGYSSKLAS